MNLNSKIVIVTGASVGIGRAICKALVKDGAVVIGCARNIEMLNKISMETIGAGKMHGIQCDVTKESDIMNVFKFAEENFGKLHAVVNNAGIAEDAPLLTGKSEDWLRMLQVNVLAYAIGAREGVKLMRKCGVDDGHVINISSMSGHRVQPSPTTHFMAATKHAVKALTEGLRQEIRAEKSHIRVTAISPGNVNTEFSARTLRHTPERLPDYVSKFVEMEAEDIADAVIYALKAHPRVNVSDIHMRPTEQDD